MNTFTDSPEWASGTPMAATSSTPSSCATISSISFG
jgi:hypothetical protein